MDDLYWVGPRRSDIQGVEFLFAGAVTLFGSPDRKEANFYWKSFEEKSQIRLNHNISENYARFGSFYNNECIKILRNNPRAKFLWYTKFPSKIEQSVIHASPYNTPSSIHDFISDKLQMRLLMAREGMDIVPGKESIGESVALAKNCSYRNLKARMPGYEYFVIQGFSSSGGVNSIILKSDEDDFLLGEAGFLSCIVSGYEANCLPINIHIGVPEAGQYNNEILLFPPSIQIIDHQSGRLLYAGGDYSAVNNILTDRQVQNIFEHAKSVGKTIQDIGFVGIAGIDFLLLKNGNLKFVEVNPRFQGSSPLVNNALKKEGLVSLQEFHISCFAAQEVHEYRLVKAEGSFYAPLFMNKYQKMEPADSDQVFTSPDGRESKFNETELKLEVKTDGAEKISAFEPMAATLKYVFNQAITGVNSEDNLVLFPPIKRLTQRKPKVFEANSLTAIEDQARLKFHLLSYGAKLSTGAVNQLKFRHDFLTMRDGVAGGLVCRMFGNVYISIPIKEFFAFLSPFEIDIDNHGGFILKYEGKELSSIEILAIPELVWQQTSTGVPMMNFSHLITDRLAISPYRGCRYNSSGKNNTACAFCDAAQLGTPKKMDLSGLKETLEFCEEKKIMEHILISGGTPNEPGWDFFYDVLELVRKISQTKIYLMITPPADTGHYEGFFKSGVNELGMNIEVFDETLAKRYLPGKSNISNAEYFKGFEIARQFWSKPGDLRSILIVGLESMTQTLSGVSALAERGIMPILSPFTPIINTDLQFHPQQEPEFLYELWHKGQEICEKNALTLGPTCVACQTNTIAMPLPDKGYLNYKRELC